MSDTPPPETSRAPEPPYAKAPRIRTLPEFITNPDNEEVSTSQSSSGVPTSQESTETKTMTLRDLRVLRDKLDGYVDRETGSTAKNGPKYDHLSQTPTSSQASGSQVNYGSQESANELADLENDLIPYFTETLGWEGICRCLKGCMNVKPGPFESKEEESHATDDLCDKLNEDVHAILKLMDACLDTEPCDTVAAEDHQTTSQTKARPGKRESFSDKVVFRDEAAGESSPRKRTRSAGMQPNWTAPPPSP